MQLYVFICTHTRTHAQYIHVCTLRMCEWVCVRMCVGVIIYLIIYLYMNEKTEDNMKCLLHLLTYTEHSLWTSIFSQVISFTVPWLMTHLTPIIHQPNSSTCMDIYHINYIHNCLCIHPSVYIAIKLNIRTLTSLPSLYHTPHFLLHSKHLSCCQDPVTLPARRRLVALMTFVRKRPLTYYRNKWTV